jgi:hypothetical protein
VLLGPWSNLDRTGHCMGRHAALGSEMAWAEDRATWRHDPSADPGTKTEGGGTMPPCLTPSGLVRKR